jgi:hypothetical protein
LFEEVVMALSRPVLRALEDFRASIKDLGHPRDREKAWSMFAYLEARGERPNHDEVKNWLMEHLFYETDARDMANMTDDIRYLKERLRPGAVGWGRPDTWFGEE